MRGTSVITADPNPIQLSDHFGRGATTLAWRAEGTEAVEVHLGAPDGPLFSRGGAVGGAQTGPWVTNGMIFYLQDVSGELPLSETHTLATVTVKVNSAVSLEVSRLRSLPRYQHAITTIAGISLEIVDAESFLVMYRDIFEQEIYRFQASDERPYIIDGGANIGMSTLYFKNLYPLSRIIAFEPDKEIFSILQRNIQQSRYEDITLVDCAISSSETEVRFMSEGADAGRIARTGDPSDKTVPSVRLRNYLDRRVDLLKLNIEGAETEVLVDCADLLHQVDNLIVEYHSFVDEPQTLHTLIGTLAEAGFRLYVKCVADSPQPLMHRAVCLRMDLQLYIYAFRSQRSSSALSSTE